MSVKLELAGLDRYDKITTIANMNPVYCMEYDSIMEVVEKIIKTNHRRMPILSRRKDIKGILTISDILDAFLRKDDFKDKISTIMIRDIVFCLESDTIEFVLQKFKLSRRGGFPVLRGNKLIGMVSERDFVKHFAGVDFNAKVRDVMTPKPFFISPDISILDCLKTIVNTHYRRLPVVDDEKIIGIVTSADMLSYIKQHKYDFEALDEPLEPIIKREVFTVSGDEDVSEAIRLMKEKDVGGLVVSKEDVLEGIITERDVLEEIV